MKIRNIREVGESCLCSGCGACAYACGDNAEMVDIVDLGRRPRFSHANSEDRRSELAMLVCPGIGLAHDPIRLPGGIVESHRSAWGPILAIWEGYARDANIRYAGSSGGATTAIALHSIEQGGMHGVLHTAARKDAPYFNETVMSLSRGELLAATGSRYAPASPCDGLRLIEEAPAPCVFVGKPCDVAATWKARRVFSKLDDKLGLTIAFFCAGTPSTLGTIKLLRSMGVEDLTTLKSLRYRGNGWPGKATAILINDDGEEVVRELTYEQSWGEILSQYQQWRCKVCADHTGEFADIAVGDPWYRAIGPEEFGRSLILARTERGRDAILAAERAGYLVLEEKPARILPDSQPNLLKTRGAIWGRLMVSRVLGVPYPTYKGMPTFRHWVRELNWWEKTQSIVGTAKRILAGHLDVSGSSNLDKLS